MPCRSSSAPGVPQRPSRSSQATPGWFFAAGTYRFTLTADRVVASDALRASFTLVIKPEDLAVLNATGPERFLTYPVVP